MRGFATNQLLWDPKFLYQINIKLKTLKVTCTIKHRNTPEEIITYTQSLLLITEAWKKKYNILTLTLHSYSPWHAVLASDLCSIHISVRGYTNMMAMT